MPVKHYDCNWTFDYTAWAYDVFTKRCESNMTMAEMGGRCGISTSVINKIETLQWVSFPTIILLSDVLDLKLIAYLKR